MILKLPVGNMRSPTFALVDTTAMAIQPSPNVWQASTFSDDGAYGMIGGHRRYIQKGRIEHLAREHKVSADEVRSAFADAIERARSEWRASAERGMAETYGNAYVTLPAGETVNTHATVEDIEQAIVAARGSPIVSVYHVYPELPTFDERGLPPREPGTNDEPF